MYDIELPLNEILEAASEYLEGTPTADLAELFYQSTSNMEQEL